MIPFKINIISKPPVEKDSEEEVIVIRNKNGALYFGCFCRYNGELDITIDIKDAMQYDSFQSAYESLDCYPSCKQYYEPVKIKKP